MSDESSDGGAMPSRREMLASFAAAAAVLAAHPNLPLAAAQDVSTLPVNDAATARLAAAALNPNYQRLVRIVGTVVCSKSGRTFVWFEKRASDGEIVIMKQTPEMSMEWADVTELYEASRWRSWRTPGDLDALVADGGEWIIRLSACGAFCMIARASAPPLKAQPIDAPAFAALQRPFTADPAAAARFTSAEVQRIVPHLMAAWELTDEHPVYFEPVRPDEALLDLRLKLMRTEGWGPRVGQTYDGPELRKTFGVTVAIGRRGPFTKVAGGFAFLIDYGTGPGETTLGSSDVLTWSAKCPRVDQPDHDTACDCLPQEFRAADGPALAYVFARAGSTGSYTYFGLGHAYGRRGDRVSFRIEPSVTRERFGAIGGYTGWEMTVAIPDGEYSTFRVSGSADVAERFPQLDTTYRATVSLRQWGGAVFETSFAADRAVIEYFRLDDSSVSGSRVDPAFVGDPSEFVPLEPNDEDLDWVAARSILKRADVLPILMSAVDADGEPPAPELWVRNPLEPDEST